MTEEAQSKDPEEETQRAEASEDQPQIYSVKKGLGGWKFSRRGFLTTAATVTAAAVAGAAAGTGESKPATSEAAEEAGKPTALSVKMQALTVVTAGQSFTQLWRLTNPSRAAWFKEASLRLTDSAPVQAPASVAIPDIAPGATVEIPVEMTAPPQAGAYQCSWRLQAADGAAPVTTLPLVVLQGCLIESPHPYQNNSSQTWIVNNPDTNAQFTQVHFSQVQVETNWDYVILRDNLGEEHQRITGNYSSGLWSVPIPGAVVQLQLLSDSVVTGWGFCLDQVMTTTVVRVYLPLVSKAPTPTPTPRPTATPCACYGVCSCNPHCTCDRIHYWYPN